MSSPLAASHDSKAPKLGTMCVVGDLQSSKDASDAGQLLSPLFPHRTKTGSLAIRICPLLSKKKKKNALDFNDVFAPALIQNPLRANKWSASMSVVSKVSKLLKSCMSTFRWSSGSRAGVSVASTALSMSINIEVPCTLFLFSSRTLLDYQDHRSNAECLLRMFQKSSIMFFIFFALFLFQAAINSRYG